MKNMREIRIVYRNYFFYLLRWFLPKSTHLFALVNGRWLKCKLKPGFKYGVKIKEVRPSRLIEAIVFEVVVTKK